MKNITLKTFSCDNFKLNGNCYPARLENDNNDKQ